MSVTDESKAASARFDRKAMVVLVPVLVLMLAGLYVRVTSDNDPLWTELTTPLFFGLVGARSILRPVPPETRKAPIQISAAIPRKITPSVTLRPLTIPPASSVRS